MKERFFADWYGRQMNWLSMSSCIKVHCSQKLFGENEFMIGCVNKKYQMVELWGLIPTNFKPLSLVSWNVTVSDYRFACRMV